LRRTPFQTSSFDEQIGIDDEVEVEVARDDARVEGLSSWGLLRFKEETGGSCSEPLPYPDLILIIGE
jgi:hypothetical protein